MSGALFVAIQKQQQHLHLNYLLMSILKAQVTSHACFLTVRGNCRTQFKYFKDFPRLGVISKKMSELTFLCLADIRSVPSSAGFPCAIYAAQFYIRTSSRLVCGPVSVVNDGVIQPQPFPCRKKNKQIKYVLFPHEIIKIKKDFSAILLEKENSPYSMIWR